MKKEKQKQIEQLIEQTFNNIQKLQDLLTEKDLKWADKNCDEDDVALSISGFSENLIDWGKMFRSWPKLNFPYNRRMMKNKYTVDVAVTIFLQKEVTAGDEGEANQMAEDGISLNDVTKAYNNGECEIEIIGSEVEEEDSE